MKKILIIGLSWIFLISFMGFVSSNVEITNSVNSVYNLGEIIDLEVEILAEEDISDSFSVYLVCGLREVEVYKEFLSLLSGESRKKEIMIPLIDNFIGISRGDCYIFYNLGSSGEKLVENFRISDSIKITLDLDSREVKPGELIGLSGFIVKENGEGVKGILETFVKGAEQGDISSSIEVNGGSFNAEVLIPKNFKSGTHLVQFRVYELDSKGIISNQGTLESYIEVSQVPTNLEIILDEDRIEPGTSLRAKVILRDQTGEKIDAKIYAVIKNPGGEVVKKFEERTDVDLEYFFALNESPKEGIFSAYSEELTFKVPFKILEKSAVNFELINNSLVVSNIGNVPYNESLLIYIGDDNVSFNPDLKLGEVKKFTLTAPKGEYEIVVGDISKKVFLTGNSIDIKEDVINKFKFNNFIWIFIIVILLIFCIVLYRRFLRRRIFKRPQIDSDKQRIKEIRELKQEKIKKKIDAGIVSPHLKAEFSLSIHGSKQDASVMCLNLKNYESIKTGEGNVSETLQRIVDIFEGEKGFVYDNKENLFFVLAPFRTKTFQNEMKLVELGDKAERILREHNKKFKAIIDFGISLNYGTLVISETSSGLKFMSLGIFMTNAKKIAIRSKKSIYLSSEFKSRLGKDVKTELKDLGNINAHLLKEIVDKARGSTFLEGFVARQKKEMARQEEERKREGSSGTLADERD